MVLVRILGGLVMALALPSFAFAQAGGGLCLVSGRLTFSPPIGFVPSVCQSPGGCERLSISGTLAAPTCPGFDGSVSSRRGLVFGAHGCEGNVHAAVLDHSRFPGKPFSVYGVCAGGVCSGGGYTTFGVLQYDLVPDPGSIAAFASQCAAGSLQNLPVVGTAIGAAN